MTMGFDVLIPEGQRHFRDISVRNKMRDIFDFLYKTSNMEVETAADKFLFEFLFFIYGKEYEKRKRLWTK